MSLLLRRPNNGTTNTEAGLSLIELVLYVAIGAIVSIVIVGVFGSGLQNEAATRERDAATGSAQLVSTSVGNGIRNASAFEVTGALLRARVAVGSGDGWECQAWRLTGEGELQHKQSSSAIPAGGSGWATLTTGASSTGVPGEPFEKDGNRLLLQLQVEVGNETIQISAATTAEARGEGGVTECW